jgi:outer membrane lipoprotein SlyB
MLCEAFCGAVAGGMVGLMIGGHRPHEKLCLVLGSVAGAVLGLWLAGLSRRAEKPACPAG